MKPTTRRDIITALLIALGAVVGVVFVLAIGGCSDNSEPGRNSAQRSSEFDTVEHDGHWFVRWDGYRAGGILHHPDCPKCSERKAVEP